MDAVTELARTTTDAEDIRTALALAFPVDPDKPQRGTEAGMKGVRFDARTGRWMARTLGKYLGMYATAEEAQQAVRAFRLANMDAAC